jgi:hypothetical protein
MFCRKVRGNRLYFRSVLIHYRFNFVNRHIEQRPRGWYAGRCCEMLSRIIDTWNGREWRTGIEHEKYPRLVAPMISTTNPGLGLAKKRSEISREGRSDEGFDESD